MAKKKKSLVGWVDKETFEKWKFKDGHLMSFWFAENPTKKVMGLDLSENWSKVRITIEEII